MLSPTSTSVRAAVDPLTDRDAQARGRTHAGRPKPSQPLWFLIPAGLALLVFFFVPTVSNFSYAFTDWSSFKSAIDPVGFRTSATSWAAVLRGRAGWWAPVSSPAVQRAGNDEGPGKPTRTGSFPGPRDLRSPPVRRWTAMPGP